MLKWQMRHTFYAHTSGAGCMNAVHWVLLCTITHLGSNTYNGMRRLSCLMQVFAKGAKFSMFKPAEEMVYIGLDQESRTKGKAAIDVVGAQSGKSAGSVLQQVTISLLPNLMLYLFHAVAHCVPRYCMAGVK